MSNQRTNAPSVAAQRLLGSLAADMLRLALDSKAYGDAHENVAHDVMLERIDTVLRDAVAEERERCANVCQGMAVQTMMRSASPHDTASHERAIAHTEAARRIREGG